MKAKLRANTSRRAWSEAYRERERALILEPARSEDSLIGMAMQPMAGGEDASAASAAISAGIAQQKNQGLKPVIRLVNESFGFGGGEVLTATRAFIYPVIINDHVVEVDIAEVPGNCPPLLWETSPLCVLPVSGCA